MTQRVPSPIVDRPRAATPAVNPFPPLATEGGPTPVEGSPQVDQGPKSTADYTIPAPQRAHQYTREGPHLLKENACSKRTNFHHIIDQSLPPKREAWIVIDPIRVLLQLDHQHTKGDPHLLIVNTPVINTHCLTIDHPIRKEREALTVTSLIEVRKDPV